MPGEKEQSRDAAEKMTPEEVEEMRHEPPLSPGPMPESDASAAADLHPEGQEQEWRPSDEADEQQQAGEEG